MCIGSSLSALLFPGSYNAVKMAINRLSPDSQNIYKNDVTQDLFHLIKI